MLEITGKLKSYPLSTGTTTFAPGNFRRLRLDLGLNIKSLSGASVPAQKTCYDLSTQSFNKIKNNRIFYNPECFKIPKKTYQQAKTRKEIHVFKNIDKKCESHD